MLWFRARELRATIQNIYIRLQPFSIIEWCLLHTLSLQETIFTALQCHQSHLQEALRKQKTLCYCTKCQRTRCVAFGRKKKANASTQIIICYLSHFSLPVPSFVIVSNLFTLRFACRHYIAVYGSYELSLERGKRCRFADTNCCDMRNEKRYGHHVTCSRC